MTATLTQVRSALKTTLETIPGLTVYPFPPGTIDPPAAVITPAPGDFLTYQMGEKFTAGVVSNACDLELTVAVFVQWGDDQSAFEQLDGFVADNGSYSVFAAVDADQRLGGAVDGCTVTSARNFGTFTWGEATYLGCELAVQVLL